MALNFLGLGASVGIKDLGAAKMAAGLTTAFSGIGTALSGIGAKAALAATGLGALSSFAGKQFMALGHGITNIANASQNLTTGFEAEAQAHSVATRRMIAQTGIFGKELNKLNGQAAGMAMGMGMSDQTAAHAVSTFSQFKDEMKALGVESAVTAGKVEEGMGVSIRDLGFQMHRLKDGLGLTQKDMEELGKSFTATGETIHDIAGPFKSMDAVMDLAVRRTNLVKQGLSSIGGKDSIKSVNKAVQSLFILTGDAKGAQEAALGLEDKLTTSMENFRNMFTGNSTDLDAFLTNTSVVTGDVQKAFAAAANGPDAFIKEFGGVVARLKKDGKDTSEILKFFGGQMSEALGPELANRLVLAVSNADDAKMKMIKNTKDMGKSLGEMGKEAWRSTKTLKDAFEMTIGAGFSRFRQIGMKSAQEFVKATGKSFEEFNKNAEALVKEGGPLGALVTKMSEVSSIGASALLPKALQPMVAVFGTLFTSLAPAIEAFSELKVILGGMLGPVTLIVAAMAGFGYLLLKNKKDTNTWGDAISKTFDQVVNYITGFASKALSWAQKFDWKGFFKTLANGLAAGIKGLTSGVKGAGNGISGMILGDTKSNGIFAQVKELAKTIWSAMKEAFGQIDWGQLLSDLFDQILQTRGQLIKVFMGLFDKAMDALDRVDWSAVGSTVWNGFVKVLEFVGKQAVANWKIMGEALKKILTKAIDFIKSVDWAAVINGLADKLKDAGPVIKEGLKNAIPAILEFMEDLRSKILDGLWYIVKNLPEINDAILNVMKEGLGLLLDVVIGAFEGLWQHIKDQFPKVGEILESFFSTFVDGWETSLKAGMDLLDGFNSFFIGIGQKIVQLWDDLFGHSTIPELFQRGIDAMKGALQSFFDFFKDIGDKIIGMFDGVISKVKGLFGGSDSATATIQADMGDSLKTIQAATDKMKEYVQKVLFDSVTDAIVKAFSEAFRNVSDGSKAFFKAESKAFTDFGDGVARMFRQMWLSVLDDTEIAAKGISGSVNDVLKGMERVKAALEQIKAARATITDTTQPGTEPGKITPKPGESLNEAYLRTIADADWYYKDYRGLFSQGIASLVDAIAALKGNMATAGNGPTAGSAASALRRSTAFAPASALAGDGRGGVR